MRVVVILCLVLCLLSGLSFSCSVDEDCNLNGSCQGGSCMCQPAWKGSDCGILNLLPAPIAGAYNVSNNSSWGGGVVLGEDNVYHMYFALMVNHCGLNTWTQNSEIVHGIGKTPEGPFILDDVVIGPWGHNPQPHSLAEAPSQVVLGPWATNPQPQKWNGTYLIYHIGCGTEPPASPVVCTNGSTPPTEQYSKSHSADPAPCVDWAINVLTSSSPYGPWTEYFLFKAPIPNQPWPFNVDNPSAYIFPNGTTMLMFRSWGVNSTIGVAIAPSPLGPFVVPDQPIYSYHYYEDPFLWVDASTGFFHALYHAMANLPNGTYVPGVHAYSRDGFKWTMSDTPAYGFEVEFDDGTRMTLLRRERPQIYFDPTTHQPAFLYNGAQPTAACDKTFTLVTPINMR